MVLQDINNLKKDLDKFYNNNFLGEIMDYKKDLDKILNDFNFEIKMDKNWFKLIYIYNVRQYWFILFTREKSMWEEIVNLAIQNGLFAVLFLGLLIFLLKDSSKREKKYQQTIESLNRHLDIVEDIEKDVVEIKQNITDKTIKEQKKKLKNKA